MKELPIPDLNNVVPEILVGLKHARYLAERKIRTRNEEEPVAA